MKTLLVCRDAPYPPTTGSPLRLWQQVNLLASLGPVHVFSIGPPIGDDARTPLIAEWVHVDSTTWKAVRFHGILRAIKVFMPNQFPGVGDLANGTLNSRLGAFIDRIKPDLIVVSHWPNSMPAVLRKHRRKLIVDSHNIESKLWFDMTSIGSIDKMLRHWRFSRRETRLSQAASTTWVTSEIDKAALTQMSRKPISVSVWPNAIDLAYYDPARMSAAVSALGLERSFPTLIFVGYMAYEPNHDAARVLITEILPKVRLRYPGARVFVVGKNPRPDLIALANQEINVYVTGTVSDVRPYLAVSDLAVIPLTVGGGTRLKLLEAFASRLAVVSTTKGAEGIATAGSKEVAIADSVDKMVEEILSLLDDRQRWSLQVDRAYALVESQFSWQALGKRLPEEISKVLEPPTRVF